MWARRAIPVLLAALALSGCGSSDLPAPAPASVAPSRGYAASTTPITIHGDGFSVRVVQPSSGGSPVVDETFQAWLGDQPLQDVHRIDGQTLSATVPAGLAPGAKELRVQGPFGTSGVLPNAFTVEGSAQAALAAAIAAAPATVAVGQAITITLAVTNGGSSTATAVTPAAPTVTGTGAVGAPAGPDPATIATLAPGASGTFTWTYPATGAGTLAFSGAASATDSFSGTTVTAVTDPAHPAAATVVAGAGLIANLTPGRTPAVPAGQPFTVDVGQAFTLSLSVTNTGATGAVGVVPGAIASCATVSPVSAPVSPGPTPVVFLYSGCSSPTPGTLTLSASASGTDVNDPARVVTSNTASATVTVQTPAVISATGLTTSPASLTVGQGFTVTLALSRTGGAPAAVTAVSLSGTSCTTPPVVPVDVIGSTLSLTWSGCTAPAAPQTLTLEASAAWVDGNTGASLTAGPASTAVSVVPAAAVTATSIVATPATLSAGQTFSIALTLSKTGASPANVTGVSMDYAASCTTAPTLPVNDIPATLTLVWTGCTAPATPQLLSISGFATWVDAILPAVSHPTNSTSTAVVVQSPAALAVTFASQPPSPVSAGQVVTLVANVQNTAAAGGASASDVIVAPTATGTGGAAAACSATSPTSAVVAAGASVPFTFTCTPSGAGTLTFTASASGLAANSGGVLVASATTAPATTVLAAAALAVTFASQPPSPVSAGQVVTLVANVHNTAPAGGADATGVTVAPTATGSVGASAACTAASPASATVPAGSTVPFTFSCTPSGAGTVTFTATANGTAAGSLAPLSVSVTTSPATTVLAAASLAVAFASQPASPTPAGVPISMTANVQNTAPAGGASAIGVVVTATASGNGNASATCTAATPASATLAPGETVPFTFDCTPSGGPSITFTATASGTDSGSGAPISASATTSPATRIQ